MWKQKLGISVGDSYSVSSAEIVRLVADIGFDAISPVWLDNNSTEILSETASKCGLAVQSLHAPFDISAQMWDADKSSAARALDKLLLSLEDCRRFDIPILVAHTWIGFDNIPEPTREGCENFERLAENAASYGIKIAFENTEGEEHLVALMKHFENCPDVGFCWDSGHEMCYNHSRDLLADYGDRLIMTHLNDNLGISRFDGKTYWTDDLHLLPYDGIADWDYNAERLKKSKPQEYLNFELNITSKPDRHENDIYSDMTLERYFTEAYKRACRIAYKLCF